MELLTVDYKSPDAAKNFLKSMKATGFAVLSNHPITKDTIFSTYNDWEKFFSTDSKHDYKFNPESQDGFFPFRSENAKGYSKKDLKEFYHLYPKTNPPEIVKKSTLNLFTQMQELATELLGWIDQELPEEVSSKLSIPLSQMIKESPQTLLRVLHYPPLSGEEELGAVRAAAHGDINLITLLPTATEPGLQVLNSSGEWYDVPCDPGQISINVGDMLEMATGSYLKSTQHRVINPTHVDKMKNPRYSMPLFLHPRPEVRLSSTHTADDYLTERLKEIGLK